jgi:hypothetical protein
MSVAPAGDSLASENLLNVEGRPENPFAVCEAIQTSKERTMEKCSLQSIRIPNPEKDHSIQRHPALVKNR